MRTPTIQSKEKSIQLQEQAIKLRKQIDLSPENRELKSELGNLYDLNKKENKLFYRFNEFVDYILDWQKREITAAEAYVIQAVIENPQKTFEILNRLIQAQKLTLINENKQNLLVVILRKIPYAHEQALWLRQLIDLTGQDSAEFKKELSDLYSPPGIKNDKLPFSLSNIADYFLDWKKREIITAKAYLIKAMAESKKAKEVVAKTLNELIQSKQLLLSEEKQELLTNLSREAEYIGKKYTSDDIVVYLVDWFANVENAWPYVKRAAADKFILFRESLQTLVKENKISAANQILVLNTLYQQGDIGIDAGFVSAYLEDAFIFNIKTAEYFIIELSLKRFPEIQEKLDFLLKDNVISPQLANCFLGSVYAATLPNDKNQQRLIYDPNHIIFYISDWHVRKIEAAFPYVKQAYIRNRDLLLKNLHLVIQDKEQFALILKDIDPAIKLNEQHKSNQSRGHFFLRTFGKNNFSSKRQPAISAPSLVYNSGREISPPPNSLGDIPLFVIYAVNSEDRKTFLAKNSNLIDDFKKFDARRDDYYQNGAYTRQGLFELMSILIKHHKKYSLDKDNLLTKILSLIYTFHRDLEALETGQAFFKAILTLEKKQQFTVATCYAVYLNPQYIDLLSIQFELISSYENIQKINQLADFIILIIEKILPENVHEYELTDYVKKLYRYGGNIIKAYHYLKAKKQISWKIISFLLLYADKDQLLLLKAVTLLYEKEMLEPKFLEYLLNSDTFGKFQNENDIIEWMKILSEKKILKKKSPLDARNKNKSIAYADITTIQKFLEQSNQKGLGSKENVTSIGRFVSPLRRALDNLLQDKKLSDAENIKDIFDIFLNNPELSDLLLAAKNQLDQYSINLKKYVYCLQAIASIGISNDAELSKIELFSIIMDLNKFHLLNEEYLQAITANYRTFRDVYYKHLVRLSLNCNGESMKLLCDSFLFYKNDQQNTKFKAIINSIKALEISDDSQKHFSKIFIEFLTISTNPPQRLLTSLAKHASLKGKSITFDSGSQERIRNAIQKSLERESQADVNLKNQESETPGEEEKEDSNEISLRPKPQRNRANTMGADCKKSFSSNSDNTPSPSFFVSANNSDKTTSLNQDSADSEKKQNSQGALLEAKSRLRSQTSKAKLSDEKNLSHTYGSSGSDINSN